MSRRGENIYKRKDGRWEARYLKTRDSNGKAKYGYIYAKNYSEAKRKLYEKKIMPIEQSFAPKAKYSALLDEWLEYIETRVKASTFAQYAHIIQRHIRPSLGDHFICALNNRMLENYMHQLLTVGRIDHSGGLSAKTVNDIFVVVKASLKYASNHDYNLCCRLDNLHVKNSQAELSVLSKEECQKLTQWLMTDMDANKFGVLLSLYTGIRVGELCALQWKHIRLSDGMLLVRGTVQRIPQLDANTGTKTRVFLNRPKSRCAYRDIPLPEFLQNAAQTLQQEPEAYLLTGQNGSYTEPRTVQNRFKRYAELCGIRPVNYHTLRHTFATLCVELGFEIKSLSEILGHANVNITLNKYVHSSIELKRSNMKKIIPIESPSE